MMKLIKNIFIIAIAVLLTESCNSQPAPIVVGKDQCDYCRMGISDSKFGGEIVTVKDKKYKFDDVHCLLSFINKKMIGKSKIQDVYIVDFASDNHPLINVKTALLLQSNLFNSPMNGNIAAFSSEAAMNKIKDEYKANIVSWSQLIK